MKRVVPLLVLLGLTACGGTLPLDTASCRAAESSLMDEAGSRLTDDGVLRNGYVRDESGRTFFSAEFVDADKDMDSDGVVLTWVVEPGGLVSVDERARKKTSWPESDDLDVRDDGATESRACVLEVLRDS